jgi:Tol biopolymer transport system component
MSFTPLTTQLTEKTSNPTRPTVEYTPLFTPTAMDTEKLSGSLAFAFNSDQNNRSGIVLFSLDNDQWRFVSKDIGSVWYSDVAWSPDGKKITYSWGSAGEIENHIRIIDIGSSIDNDLVPGEQSTFSPDGQFLAFIQKGKLLILDLNSFQIKPIGNFSNSTRPVWSPDGKYIAYLRYDVRGINLYNWETHDTTVIASGLPGWGNISWSPDNKKIVFRDNVDCGNICVVDIESGQSHCITSTLSGETDPSWSPDGQWIAYASLDLQKYCSALALPWKINIIKIDGSGGRLLNFPLVGTMTNPVWNPIVTIIIGHSYTVTVLGDKVRLRETPSLEGRELKKLRTGEIITTIEGPSGLDKKWWKIKTLDGSEGWVFNQDGWFR